MSNDYIKPVNPGAGGHDPYFSARAAQETLKNRKKTPDKKPSDPAETKITPKEDGGQIFSEVHNMISGSKKSVDLEMYELQNAKLQNIWSGVAQGEGAKDQQMIVDDLVSAAKRGVKVRVILDASPDRFNKGTAHNQQIAEYLKANGVEVLTYPPKNVNIDHVKLLVVDDNKALIGGMNWGAHSPDNKDADVLIEGNEAAELKRDIFNRDVKFAGGKPDDTVVGPVKEDKIKALITSPKADGGGSHAIRETLLSDINGAKKKIYAEMFTLTDAEVVNSLIDAHNRGVDVKVILDPNQHYTNQKSYDALKAAGVPVRWYQVNVETRQKLHSKWGVFDEKKTLIGSANWAAQGLSTEKNNRANHEADVEVTDKTVNANFTKTFIQDWAKSDDRLPEGLPGPSF